MARFYPKGYMGSERAILKIAQTRDPARWAESRILPDEKSVWNGLGVTLNALLIENHLMVLKKDERRANDTSMIDRLCDYSDAMIELQKALYAGDIVACFCDEQGKMDFILKDGWGGDHGQDILLQGVVDLEGGIWRRVVLLKIEDIENLARALPSAWPDDLGGATKAAIVKQPAVEKRIKFQNWRESLAGRIPTRTEDIEAMRKLGINRDDARQLRKDHPSLPRGKPKGK